MGQVQEGLLIGLVVGIVDVVVFKFVFGFPLSLLDGAGAVAFWIAAGLIVHTSAINIPPVARGAVLSLVIGAAWLIDALNRGAPEETGFLAVIFLVFGVITGLLSGKVASLSQRKATQGL